MSHVERRIAPRPARLPFVRVRAVCALLGHDRRWYQLDDMTLVACRRCGDLARDGVTAAGVAPWPIGPRAPRPR